MKGKARIVLASTSPRRTAILGQLGIPHTVAASNVDEKSVSKKNPRAYVRKLAVMKAASVASRYKNAIVIGADTIVIVGNTVLGKPKNARAAVRMLKALSGKSHNVVTAICVVDTRSGRRIVKSVATRVRFRKLANSEIIKYVKTGEPLDKAGSYAIQGRGAALIERINGDFYNVVGLPVSELLKVLEGLHVRP